MPYAIELFFDDSTTSFIQSLWQKLQQAKLKGYVPRHPARPHITLAVYRKVDEGLIPGLLLKLAQKMQPFPIEFHGLGLFPSGVVYSVPVLSETLASVQKQWLSLENKVFSRIDDDQHSWAPHVTLIKRLRPTMWSKVIDYLSKEAWPKVAAVDSVACVRFPPTTEIAVIRLGSTTYGDLSLEEKLH